MKKDQDNIEIIEQYLEGKLDEEGIKKVEENLKNDEGFADQVKTYKLLVDGIKYSGRKELLNNIRHWDQELLDNPAKESPSIPLQNVKWYHIAASVVFFAVAGLVMHLNMNSGYDRLVATHYERFDHDPGTTRGEKVERSTKGDIIGLYNNGRYEEVINMINDLDESQKSNHTDFIMGNTYQESGEFENAIMMYEKVVQSGESYVIDSKWYMALCYLSLENPDQARPILEELENLNSYYGPKAKKLLADLE